jgi:short-subunit dehydrogenase
MDRGFVASLASTPEKTAKLIVRGLCKKKTRIITGADAHLMNFLYKLMPVKGPRLIRKILKKSGLDAFRDI